MYLGIDIGGTFIKYGLLSNGGEVSEKGKIPTEKTKDEILKSLQGLYLKFKDRGLKGIAMSVPGLIDVENGIMISAGATPLAGTHMSEELSALCDGIKVSVENDGKAAALAEAWLGAAKDVPNCCVLGMGTGIAGATILNKKALRGPHLIAGEMSAFPIPTNHHEVKVKQMAFYWSTGTACAQAAKAVGQESMDGVELMKRYRAGEEAIVEVVEEWFYQIAVLCHQLALTVDPDVICIGGGISADPDFTAGIQKYVHKIVEAGGYWFLEPKVVTCQFRNDSNLIGALYNFKQLYEGE